MELNIYQDHETLSFNAATKILEQVQAKPDSVLCLAAGDTPRLAYKLFGEMAAKRDVDLSACSFVGLDEWLGIPPENEGSCAYFLHHNLFFPMRIADSQIHLFNSLTDDPAAECRSMDDHIHRMGGIDLMLVGVGMNGHIGFNEPGANEQLYSHVIELDETTRSVGQKYFKQPTQLQKGITLGLRHLLESRKVLMMASGNKKAEIMRKALEGAITTDVPASVVRRHTSGMAMLDREAAGSLDVVRH